MKWEPRKIIAKFRFNIHNHLIKKKDETIILGLIAEIF